MNVLIIFDGSLVGVLNQMYGPSVFNYFMLDPGSDTFAVSPQDSDIPFL